MNLNLNYEGFEKYLDGTKALIDGIGYVFRFPNGYGASVAKHRFSYGHRDDLWELAVLSFGVDGVWDIVYDTPITQDVCGYLSDKEVCDLLTRIKQLQQPERRKQWM